MFKNSIRLGNIFFFSSIIQKQFDIHVSDIQIIRFNQIVERYIENVSNIL